MPHLDDISGWITEKLPALLAEHKVPGAAIGVYADGEVFDFASGVLSHATGVEATTDTLFQIGSISKVWTATLAMQLYREVFAELAGIEMPAAIEPPPVSAGEGPVAADITPHLGSYQRAGVLIEVLDGTEKTEGPTLRTTVTGPIAEITPDPVEEYAMTPAGPDLWLVRAPGTQTWAPVTFYSLPTGERYLHFGVRATPKA